MTVTLHHLRWRERAAALRKQGRNGASLAASRRSNPALLLGGRIFRGMTRLLRRRKGERLEKHQARGAVGSDARSLRQSARWALDVSAATIGHVMGVLRPIWHDKNRDRLQGAGTHRGRAGLCHSPRMTKRSWSRARRRHQASMLPSRAKIALTEHRSALPWETGASMADLRGRTLRAGWRCISPF